MHGLVVEHAIPVGVVARKSGSRCFVVSLAEENNESQYIVPLHGQHSHFNSVHLLIDISAVERATYTTEQSQWCIGPNLNQQLLVSASYHSRAIDDWQQLKHRDSDRAMGISHQIR